MAINELTKKEQIINFAQSDPFLKITDIAENVQTTPRYVRTILSEANISLMKLREKYAKNMEERLKSNKYNDLQAKVSLRDEYSYNNVNTGNITIKPYNDSNYEDIKKIKEDDELMKISQVQYVDESPYCIHELITYMDSNVNKERLENLDTIYDLLGRKGINRLKFMNNIITVRKPDKEYLTYFNEDDNVLVCERTVLLNRIPIGIEKIHLQGDLTKMEFAGEIIV